MKDERTAHLNSAPFFDSNHRPERRDALFVPQSKDRSQEQALSVDLPFDCGAENTPLRSPYGDLRQGNEFIPSQ